MIRWDNENSSGDKEFAVKEVKLTNDYAGRNSRQGNFSREILLTEGFFDHLREHAVPLDENAIRQLRDSATALDLYTWLAYRLPRIARANPTLLSWTQLASHFGNEGNNIRKFRQTVRDAWERHVSAVYPEARAEFDTVAIRLYASPAPLQRRPLRLASINSPGKSPAASVLVPQNTFLQALRVAFGAVLARAWLADASVEFRDEGVTLFLGSAFKADYVRQNFSVQIARAETECALTKPVLIVARARALS